MSKILIIPDIHQDTPWADSILAEHAEFVDKIKFTADYFDSFRHDLTGVGATCRWLFGLKHQYGKKLELHLGNHDAAYLEYWVKRCDQGKQWYSGRLMTMCSGFTRNKADNIADALDEGFEQVSEHYAKDELTLNEMFKLFSVDEGVLYSHAGWHPWWEAEKGHTVLVHPPLKDALRMPTDYPQFFGVGFSRGGDYPYGGVTWCDTSELTGIKQGTSDSWLNRPGSHGLHQIVGHTAGKCRVEVMNFVNGTKLVNLDGGQRTYGILDTSTMELTVKLKPRTMGSYVPYASSGMGNWDADNETFDCETWTHTREPHPRDVRRVWTEDHGELVIPLNKDR